MKKSMWAAAALVWVGLHGASYAASPLVIAFSQPTPTLADNTPAGTVISTVAVTYSDGTTPGSVTLTSSNPSLAVINGTNVVLARDLTTADDGLHIVSITAGALVFSDPVDVQITITIPGAGVPGVTLIPSSASVSDTATAGTVLATASVTMSDNSVFAGSLLSSNPALVGVSGLNVVLARDLTSNDAGFYNITIAAQP